MHQLGYDPTIDSSQSVDPTNVLNSGDREEVEVERNGDGGGGVLNDVVEIETAELLR